MHVDSSQWEGEVNAENIEQVREALGKRMKTRHIAVDKFDLFTKDDLVEGDYVIFTPTNVTLRLVYGSERV
jgi:fructose-1,6-bisphosphatase/sedoheptulose 1,7-bisphosphatase-like protein